MDVLELQEQDLEIWDQYLCSCHSGTFYQLSAWKEIMETVFSHEPHFLYAKEDNRITGILPLVCIKGLLFESYLSSMPGGLCAENQQAADALLERAKELFNRYKAKYLILRDGRREWEFPGFVTTADHCTLVVKLPSSTEQAWSRIQREERRLIKRAISTGVKTETNQDRINDFYSTYLLAMQQKGTPPFGIDFFQQLKDKFPANFTLQTVQFNDQIIAGGFIAPLNGTVFCTWAGIPESSYRFRPSHLLLWEAIKFGCENGSQWVDLGRSQRDTGSYKFKLSMGAEPQPLYQQFYLSGSSKKPAVGSERKEQAFYHLFVYIWRRLPLGLTKELGPVLRKRVPFG